MLMKFQRSLKTVADVIVSDLFRIDNWNINHSFLGDRYILGVRQPGVEPVVSRTRSVHSVTELLKLTNSREYIDLSFQTTILSSKQN